MDDYSYLLPEDTTNYPLLWSLGGILLAAIICLVFLFKYAKEGKKENMVNWRKHTGWPICEILSLAITIIFLYIGKEINHFSFFLSLLFIIFGVLALVSFVFCFLYFDSLNEKDHKKDLAKK